MRDEFNLMTVVLHELGHGLGFLGSMDVTGGIGDWGLSGFPIVYDRFSINGASQSLLNTMLFPNPSAALGMQLASNDVFFNGLNARNTNGGIAPKLYAPNRWDSGSSYSHLDESAYPNGTLNSLMTPALGPGQAIHDIGPIVRGIFLDMGWTGSRSDVTGDFDGDFDGDRRADITVYRPSTAGWWILRSSSNYTTYANYAWGAPGDIPLADYDGDRKTDIAIYRPSTADWWIGGPARITPLVASTFGASPATCRSPPITMEMEEPTSRSIAHPTADWWIRSSSANYTIGSVYVWGIAGRPASPRRLRWRWKSRHRDLSPIHRRLVN